MQKNRSQGFTLIELLVVIAIIGILSAIVLASLQSARSKGQDATVISDITGIRTQAEIYRTSNNNYGANDTGATVSDCNAYLFSDATIQNQITGAKNANGGLDLVCNVADGGAAYAVSAPLVATPGTYFCVDSTGISTTTGAALGATATSCS